MARLVSAKTESDIKLDGITVEFTRVNDSVQAVTLRDKEHFVTFRVDSYTLQVLVAAPPKYAERWVLEGEVLTVKVYHEFEYEHEALGARDDFRRKVRNPEDDCKLVVEKRNVLVKED